MSDNKDMNKTLKNLKYYKHYEKLVNKSNGKGTIPQIRWISDLLTELNIEHRYHNWTETKWRPNGLRYHTSGGSKEYTGGRLWISDINLDICSTDTYYSWNTWSYVEKILNYINEKINLK